jgi:PhnB protein
MAVKPIPDCFNTVSCYLIVKNAVEALEFYRKAFGAEPGVRMPGPDGSSTLHSEMHIGNSTVMLTDENPQWGMKAPQTLGGTPASLHIYVEDADKLYDRAVKAGCTVMSPLMDAFWGDRYGKVQDPFGHQWGIATHKEDLSPEEMGKRAAEFFANMGDCQ